VWDSQDDPSAFALGPQFTTPKHHYPVPNFTWIPPLPASQESVQFTDQTNFAAGATGRTWSWSFGDGGSSVLQNPSHTYTSNGIFSVSLGATDDVGTCPKIKTIIISLPFPEWQEISPF
jgi:PKD repeat protein